MVSPFVFSSSPREYRMEFVPGMLTRMLMQGPETRPGAGSAFPSCDSIAQRAFHPCSLWRCWDAGCALRDAAPPFPALPEECAHLSQ